MELKGFVFRTFGPFTVKEISETEYELAFPAYRVFKEIKQRESIPLMFEILADDLENEGHAQWHHRKIRLRISRPFTPDEKQKFVKAAKNMMKGFLTHPFWMGFILGAHAEHKLMEGAEEIESEDTERPQEH